MQKFPNNIKKNKSHKIKTYKGLKSKNLSFYKSGVKTRSINYLTWENFESFRKVYVRAFRTREVKNKKNFKLIKSALNKKKKKKKSQQKKKSLIFKAHFWSPLTKKPLQVRMGKGKGNPYKWVFPASANRILMEHLTNIRKNKIKKVMSKAFKKMPLNFKFILNKGTNVFPRRLGNKIFINYNHTSYKEVEFFTRNKFKYKKTNE